jgi:sugar/nucleoside kinase (ribokinase family)
MDAQFDVVGIGNAMVDVLAQVRDTVLVEHGLTKGEMRLINAEQAYTLYATLDRPMERSGGSAGNTMAGISSLGARGAYIGKVADDALGRVFAEDLRSVGTHFATAPLQAGPATARCIVLVTPDAHRTMNTYLGACVELNPSDIPLELISGSKITYLEGYLWDPPQAKQALLLAAKTARAAGRKVSLSLSDAFCVGRHRAEFLDLVHNHVDILFANETEILSLYECSNFDEAVRRVQGRCEVAVLTRSERGAVVVSHGESFAVPAETVARVVDTTGAGDLYAAGFLAGYASGRQLGDCARMGAIAAAEVISHFGARPEISLQQRVRERL